MDISSYYYCQILCQDLFDLVIENLQPLHTKVYQQDAIDKNGNWQKVLKEFPIELEKLPIDDDMNTNYKKVMSIFMYHVLQKRNVRSVASVSEFLRRFFGNFVKHYSLRAGAKVGPIFFEKNTYVDQKKIITDVVRATITELAGKTRNSRPRLVTNLSSNIQSKIKHSAMAEKQKNASVASTKSHLCMHLSNEKSKHVQLSSGNVYTPNIKSGLVKPDDSVSVAFIQKNKSEMTKRR